MIRRLIQGFHLGQLLNKIKESNIETIDYKSIRNINDLANKTYKLRMPEMVAIETFKASLNSKQVNYADSCNTTVLVNSENFKTFVEKTMVSNNNKYVFHNVTKDPNIVHTIDKLIPIPKFLPVKKTNQLRICRLYAGGKYSGTNLHNHSAALNYLVSGKKLWITFPFNKETHAFVESNAMKYGTVKQHTIKWLRNNLSLLLSKESELGLNFFTQKSSEVVYLPAGHYHAIINLDNCIGITYSWN